MPEGYFHLRLFDEATNSEFAAAWATEPGTSITPALIEMQVMISELFLDNAWVATLPNDNVRGPVVVHLKAQTGGPEKKVDSIEPRRRCTVRSWLFSL